MNRRFLWGLLLCGLILAGWEGVLCSPGRATVRIEQQAKAGLAKFAGSIGVTFIDFKDRRSSFVIRRGQVEAIEVLPEAPPKSTARGAIISHPSLPPVAGYSGTGPNVSDPDRRLVVAALKPKLQGLSSTTAVRVVDVKTDETLFVFDDGEEWLVSALAWAPDSSAVAVVRAEYSRRLCVRDLFWAMTKWGTYLKTYHLFVLDMDGTILVTTTLAEPAMEDYVELVWLE